MQPDPNRRLPQDGEYNPYLFPFGPPAAGAARQTIATSPTLTPMPSTATSAVISMVLGIVSPLLFCVALGIFPALAAIIVGHVALGRIKRSNGALAGRGFAITGLAIGYPMLLLSALSLAVMIPAMQRARDRAARQNAGQNADEELDDEDQAQQAGQRLRDAESKIIGASNGPAHGNCPAAITLASQFAEGMKTLRETFFTKNDKKSFTLANGQFVTYCELHDDRCAFVVHVPEYRKFTDKAKKQLAALAWAAASSVVTDKLDKQDQLGIGLKGTFIYGAIMVGTVGGEQPELDGDRDDLVPFFLLEQAEAEPRRIEPVDVGPSEAEADPFGVPAEVEQPLPSAKPIVISDSTPRVTPRAAPQSKPAEPLDEGAKSLLNEGGKNDPRRPEYLPGRGIPPARVSQPPRSHPRPTRSERMLPPTSLPRPTGPDSTMPRTTPPRPTVPLPPRRPPGIGHGPRPPDQYDEPREK